MIGIENNILNQQGHKPEKITEKKWTEEYGGSRQNTQLTWNNFILSISFESGGGFQHQFKAYILETSDEQKSFVVLLEDQNIEDSHDGVKRNIVKVDLKDYAEQGTLFKVLTLGWGGLGSKIGETTFMMHS